MISGLDFVSIQVADMARAKAFYQDDLGLPPVAAEGAGWAEFDLGPGPALTLLDPAAFGDRFDEDGGGSFGLAMTDIEAMTKAMEAQGRLSMPMFETEVCHGGPIQDSEGNGVVLHRRKGEPGRDRVIDFVVMPVEDLARARAFYEDTLGLERSPDFGDVWTEYVLADDATLALFDMGAVGMTFAPARRNAPGLRTPELERVFAMLEAQGHARAEALIETPVCTMGLVRDSEGNALVLHRHK